MTCWKRTSFCLAIVGFAVVTTLSVVLMHAAEKPNEGDKHHLQRVFKFKTSDPNGMNIATQMKFQPSDQAKMKISVQSGRKTNSIEFTVKSELGNDTLGHSIEMKFLEQLGNAKPEIRRRPNLRTLDGVPASVQMNDFYFEILIEPVN